MALQDGQFGILFEVQTVDGALPAALQAIYTTPTGPFDDDDGAVFGNPEAGVGASGIDLTLGRNARGPARVTGGDTRKFDEFLNGTVNTFSFSWPVSGNKLALSGTPADTEFQIQSTGGSTSVGIAALYRGCGLGEGAAWGGGVGWEYKPQALEKIAALVFDSGSVYAFVDLQGTLEFAFNVGDAAMHSATFNAKLDPANPPKDAAFPVFSYGQQDVIAAPNVAEANNAFGAGRGFSELTTTIDNLIEGTPDSNAIDGERVESTGRDVSIACTLDVDDSAPSFDVGELLRDDASFASDMTFQCGDVGVAAEPATRYEVTLANLNLQDLTPTQPANAKSSQFNAFATSDVEGDELILVFS